MPLRHVGKNLPETLSSEGVRYSNHGGSRVIGNRRCPWPWNESHVGVLEWEACMCADGYGWLNFRKRRSSRRSQGVDSLVKPPTRSFAAPGTLGHAVEAQPNSNRAGERRSQLLCASCTTSLGTSLRVSSVDCTGQAKRGGSGWRAKRREQLRAKLVQLLREVHRVVHCIWLDRHAFMSTVTIHPMTASSTAA